MQPTRTIYYIDDVSAELIARHPGMRLSATGRAVPEMWIILVIATLCLPGVLALFPWTATIIQPDGLGQWRGAVKVVGLGTAALVLWICLSLLRCRANPHQDKPSLMGVLVLILIFPPFAYGMSQATLLRMVPLASAYIISKPTVVTLPYKYVKRNAPCRRRCLFERLLGVAGASYTLKLPDYPDFVAPILLHEKPEGFPIQTTSRSWPRDLPVLHIQGQGNWFGIRIQKLIPADSETA